MTWFKVDDGLHSHPKWLAASPAARALWVTAGSWCAAHLTDGRIPSHVLPLFGARPKDAAELVSAGMWDAVPHGWQFHDWELYQPSREQVMTDRAFARRRQAMNADPELRKALKARDGDQCRYCGRKVNWRDRKGSAGATYDHVVPLAAGGDESLTNLVVCCRECNTLKQSRTPEQAGMILRSPPGNPDRTKTESRRNQAGNETLPPRSVKTPDPTRPDQLNGLQGDARTHDPPNGPPPRRCATHAAVPPDIGIPPCGACADARRSHDAWRRQHPPETRDTRLDAQQQAEREAHLRHMAELEHQKAIPVDPAANVTNIAAVRAGLRGVPVHEGDT